MTKLIRIEGYTVNQQSKMLYNHSKNLWTRGSIYVYSPETKVDFRNCTVPLTYAIGIMRGINIEEGYADVELYDEKPDIENYSLGMTYLGVPINLCDGITEIIEMKIVCFQLIKD